MESQFKWRISQIFSSSLKPCQPRNMLDLAETPTSLHKHRGNPRLIELFSPKVDIYSSKTTVENPQTPPHMRNLSLSDSSSIKKEKKNDNSSVSANRFMLSSSSLESNNCEWFSNEEDPGVHVKMPSSRRSSFKTRLCPPEGSTSSIDFYNKPRYPRRKTAKVRRRRDNAIHCQKGFLQNEESVSSNDINIGSGSFRRKTAQPMKETAKNEQENAGDVLVRDGKVKGSLAVEKSSRDPYNDFKASMVEMIVEKQISKADELEQLLMCFLSLNSSFHHKIIVEVFAEILEVLFTNR